METVSGHELARTRDCRHPGRPNEAPARGRFAGYCTLQRPAQNGKTAVGKVERSAGTYAARASSLVPLGQELDQALSEYQPVRARLQQAMDAWAKGVEALAGANGSAREAEEPAGQSTEEAAEELVLDPAPDPGGIA